MSFLILAAIAKSILLKGGPYAGLAAGAAFLAAFLPFVALLVAGLRSSVPRWKGGALAAMCLLYVLPLGKDEEMVFLYAAYGFLCCAISGAALLAMLLRRTNRSIAPD